jgi:hypothetical protein
VFCHVGALLVTCNSVLLYHLHACKPGQTINMLILGSAKCQGLSAVLQPCAKC